MRVSALILGLVIPMTLVSTGCARKRPVERKVDTEGNRWAKADFETGKPWLGKVTVVNNGSNSAFGFVGLQSEVTLGYFKFTKDHLQYLNLTDPYKGPNVTDRVLNQWTIEHSDYTQKVSGGRVSNVETENDLIPFDQKRFFKVNWESAVIAESASFPFQIDETCWTRRSSRLVDDSQEIEAGAINFVVAVDYQVNPLCITYPQYFRSDFTHTMHYKYSFMQEKESSYKPYVYTGEDDPLMKKYGYFQTIVQGIDDLGRPKNTFLMNRWDDSKVQTIYFTESFPDKYKWIYNDPKIGIIQRTNAVFEKNGLKLRFEIKEPDGKQKFGDIRYSFVHFVEEADFQAPFGYGPSSAHPLTGEIISSTSVVWISDMKYYIQRLKDYEANEPVRADISPIYREMKKSLGQEAQNWSSTSSFLADTRYATLYRFLLPEFTYGNPGSPFAAHDTPMEILGASKNLEKLQNFRLQNYPDLEAIVSRTEKAVADKLKEHELRMSGPRAQAFSTIWNMNEDMFVGLGPVLKAVDTEKAINDILYRVAIHEFGHNLNLRHNFYGTVDAGIERATATDPKLLVTSSVMDYLNLKDELGLAYDWEAYDKAAMVYAYSNGAKDLPKAAGAFPYLYCTDDHVFQNPLCNQFDIGTSPSEILVSMINNYDEAYHMRNFRYGRAYWNTGSYYGSVFMTMFDIKRFVNLYQLTFTLPQVTASLAGIEGLNPVLPDAFTNAIQLDLRQSVKLSAAFYNAVIKQGDIDRSFRDQYDTFSGSLTRLGIGADKIYAARFFMGNDAFPLDPNNAGVPVSFVPLRDDLLIGGFIETMLSDSFINSGQHYLGFSDMSRAYFAINAASYFDFTGNRGAIELTRVSCFKRATFAAAFNVDLTTHPLGAAPSTDVRLALLTPTYNASADAYFVDEPQVVVMRYNGDFYVAGLIKNPYSSGMYFTQDLNGVLNSYRNYALLTEGRLPECR
ncbi:zinc-dependent metalloprotease [Oligoflexus tunisiensis]|uniref:zinc-dependent metalloprotease n=1 Tax=Oligoflexus tunisiensis TaxID=708132 RepID=UPI00159EFF25|nr:zinc-dependent metalloprotease [Oligoflexus tunisiensis]